MKPGERDDRRRPRAPAPESDREAHHRALREAAEHDPLVRERVHEPGRGGEALGEGRRVREADARHGVPVRAAGRQRERPARAVPVEAPLGVERVEERQQVVLVGAAAVEEDERAVRLGDGRGPLGERQTRAGRGFGSGVSTRLDLGAEVLEAPAAARAARRASRAARRW